MILLVDSEDPDQTTQIHRLIWAITYQKTRFHKVWPYVASVVDICCGHLFEAPK